MLISCGPRFIPLLQKSRGMRQLARLASAPRGLSHNNRGLSKSANGLCHHDGGLPRKATGKRLLAQTCAPWFSSGLRTSDNSSGLCRHQHTIPQSPLPSHAQVCLLLIMSREQLLLFERLQVVIAGAGMIGNSVAYHLVQVFLPCILVKE